MSFLCFGWCKNAIFFGVDNSLSACPDNGKNVLKDFTVDNVKISGLNWKFFDFSIYHNAMNDIYIVDFHIHLIAKNDE